jgi:hypothetical protein
MRILAAALLLTLPDGLSNAEFEKLRKDLRLKSKPWATLPWQATVTEARELAARAGKPIFMMVDTGNPIGFA